VKLTFKLNQKLPKLAWIAHVDPLAAHKTVITHGPWVEVFEQGFIEGIWDGPFAEAAFDSSACVFGSGAVVRGETLVFVSSASTTDYLYWWSSEDASHVIVANSLPLLLASRDDELDPAVENYDSINNSVMAGINRYVTKMPTKRGEVNRLMHWNLVVGEGHVKEQDKPLPPAFATFDDYFAYLTDSYRRLAEDARDVGRSRPMAIFSTQSKGYDSTAANAIAKNHGVDAVFTVTKSKGKGYFADEDRHLELDDDGTTICGFFGLKSVPIDRRALERDSGMEYLFYACMQETGDFNLLQIGADVQQPTVLITGCLGELWYGASYYAEHPGLINPNLMRGDLGNHGLTEVRLQAGYVQLAFPYIGARSRTDIFRITESEEMEPWRLHTNYDRPIPRRLAEQAGLPREQFGQVKMASGLEFPAPITPFDPGLRREYLAFLTEQGVLSRGKVWLLPLVRRWNALVWTTSPRRHVWNYYLQRAISKLIGRSFTFPQLLTRLNGSIFCFCVNKRIKDYRPAMTATTKGEAADDPRTVEG
jgi:hypothetical protein